MDIKDILFGDLDSVGVVVFVGEDSLLHEVDNGGNIFDFEDTEENRNLVISDAMNLVKIWDEGK